MTTTAMTVVQHPSLSVKYSVPVADVSRWEAQGWKRSDDTPSAATTAAVDAPKPTVAQQMGIGLLPVAGDAAQEPTAVAVDEQQDAEPSALPEPEVDPYQ